MQLSLSARLLVAYTQSTKKDIVNMYKSKPNFPKDEAEIDALLKGFDALMPPGINEGKQKLYSKYLAKQLFGINPPSWVVNEDEPRVKATLLAFETAIKDKRLQGPAANIETYDTLADAMEAAASEKEEKDRTGFTLENLPEQAELAGQPGNPKQAVAEGAEVIAQQGPWKVYRVKKGDPKGKEAGSWLGANKWWGVKWCVGRDYSGNAWEGRPYMDQGDFYFFARDGRSRYAMATDGRSGDLYNPADSVIWRTNQRNDGNFPALQATADQLNLPLDFSAVSSLPNELVPVLQAATKVDTYLAQIVPESQLKEVDTSSLDQIIAKTDASALVEDLNKNSNYRGKGMTDAILGRCVSKQNKNGMKDFSANWDQFSESLMIAYIEALASAGFKALPPSLEDYFVKEAENFEF
jgi:hypothetical protein